MSDKSSHLKGHAIERFKNEWLFSDTKEPTVDTHHLRPCGCCGQHNTPEGHDACLGTLPGVMNACCGHGYAGEAYVQFLDGHCVYGGNALTIMDILKNQSRVAREPIKTGRNINWGMAIPIIERAMGGKLYEWQVHYLKTGEYVRNGRGTGKTLAYCIKLALTHEEPICLKDIGKHRDEEHGPAYISWFKRFFYDVWIKLKDAGLPVVEIISERPKNG